MILGLIIVFSISSNVGKESDNLFQSICEGKGRNK